MFVHSPFPFPPTFCPLNSFPSFSSPPLLAASSTLLFVFHDPVFSLPPLSSLHLLCFPSAHPFFHWYLYPSFPFSYHLSWLSFLSITSIVLFSRFLHSFNSILQPSLTSIPPSHTVSRASPLSFLHRLIGLVVKASASRAKDPRFESLWRQDFSGSSHTSDLKIGTPVATLPGTWCYRVSAGTGCTGVSILWLGEVERLICNFYLSVAARKIVCADPSLRYTRMLLGR